MSPKYCELNFVSVTVIFLCLQGVSCFFVKYVKTGLCVNDTSKIQSARYTWGSVSFVELDNNCLDPHAQFRFLDNGAMFNLKRKGCLSTHKKGGHGYYLNKFYIWVPAYGVNPERYACGSNITQTPDGALSVYYQPYDEIIRQRWCAVPKSDYRLLINKGVDPYLGLTRNCDDAQDKRFIFGSVTCYGKEVKDANCPKDQYMVITTAAYRGMPATKTCGVSDDYSCQTDETCLVKKLCDGQHECNITVDDSVFPVKSCQGLTRYLYFEYHCVSTPTPTHFCNVPVHIKLISRNASSLTFSWDAPEETKQHSAITSYTVCVSHEINGTCFKKIIATEGKCVVGNLRASTKYYVRVLASNKVGSSDYSESVGYFTNGKAAEMAISGTSSTLTFALEIPTKPFDYFYVVVWKLKEGIEPASPDSYENDKLVTYTEAQKSTNPKAYIAAVVRSSGLDGNSFVLGDGKNGSDPKERRRRAATKDYYNGPLEPETKYTIFQRIFNHYKVDYFSTDWSPVAETKEYAGAPRVLTNMSSGDIKAKKGDLINLLCSAQGEPPFIFSWKKDKKPLDSFMETDKPHHSSFLVLRIKNESFGQYVCHIQDRFESATHRIHILEDTGAEKNCESSEKSARTNGKSSGKWLPGIIVLSIILLILLAIVVYFVYRYRLKSSPINTLGKKSKNRNFANDNYDNSVQNNDDNGGNDREMNANYSQTSGDDGVADYSYTHLIEKEASQ